MNISKEQARRYLLLKQGLYGEYRFVKKEGALAYIRQAGCIQYDPIDVAGRNAELTLQSRVKGFQKKQLYQLLYKDRKLIDYFDKELAVLPVEDWPYFQRYRDLCIANKQEFAGLDELEEQAVVYIRKHGPVSSASLPVDGEIYWHSSIHWSGSWHGRTKASRSVLEQLYTAGELIIHHKDGSRKYYDLAEKHIPETLLRAADPLPRTEDHMKWRLLRRIGAVGMLWNRNSTALLGLREMDTGMRNRLFQQLREEGKILPAEVDGIRSVFYIRSDDLPLLEQAMRLPLLDKRTEFLAPLDPLLWDRELIRAVFDFSYTWEIYTPREKRQYGYYVLPILHGDRLIGRLEPIVKDGMLEVNGLWLEPGVRKTKKLERSIERCLKRFARFNECDFQGDFRFAETASGVL